MAFSVEETALFLSTYDWIHKHKVTNFYVEKIWENFPSEWIDALKSLTTEELNSIPYGMTTNKWPPSFINFLEKAISLGNKRHDIKKYNSELLHISAKGLKPKKLHEIERMTHFVYKLCTETDCHHVIDVGSGLAYLDLALAGHGLDIIGLEIDAVKVHKANKKAVVENSQFESYSFCMKKDNESVGMLKKIIQDKWQPDVLDTNAEEPSVCMIGLHCCGDLSPAMIESFLKTSHIKHLICFGCCYHSMETDGMSFKNFPLSNKLNSLKPIFNQYSMRLAAQQTRAAWGKQLQEEHKSHSLNVSFRSVLELASVKYDLKFKKLKRKLARIDQQTSFESYMADIVDRTTMKELPNLEDILTLYKECKEFNGFIEPFTMLQVLFQPILEHLILVDRCEYIKECGHRCELIQLFDDGTSPRNCAIIAHKSLILDLPLKY